MSSPTLAEFVKARLDEDQADYWAFHDVSKCEALLYAEDMGAAARRDPGCDCGYPQRVLREIDAKRKRLALMAEATAEMDRLLADKHAGRAEQAMAVGRARGATVAVKYDAAVWRDHPDYDPAWSPDETMRP